MTHPDPSPVSLVDPARLFLEFWGKARPPVERPLPGWHPIAYHLLDVAAVMEAMLVARPLVLRRAAQLLRLETGDAKRLLVTLAGLHDLGKFAPAFQAQAPELWRGLRTKLSFPDPIPGRHTEDGYALWVGGFQASFGERIWPGAERVLEVLAPAIFGHHGRPVPYLDRRYRQGFPPSALSAAHACAELVVALLCPEPVRAPVPSRQASRVSSWYIAGLMTTADWIGSGTKWFPYCAPLTNDPTLGQYWSRARQAAAGAVRDAGITAPRSAPLQPFRELTGLDRDPTPLQRWAETVELPETPWLVLVEDVTGAGKTEAAQVLVHRLLVANRTAGAFWAMPTQATANAMYERQGRMLRGLFSTASGPKPSLVLAHGQQRLHEGFRATVLNPGEPLAWPPPPGSEVDDVPSTASCAAFVADDRRAALLADVGAGTIDQTLLGVLPSRFNSIRLFGLADKVLVIDEAHAYDAYMGTELEALLRFQSALGGCAVVLSATLPLAKRAGLATAWSEGLRLGGWGNMSSAVEGADALSGAYPLVTAVSVDGIRESALDTADWSRRSVTVRWVHDPAEALEHAATSASRGAAVAWVRNTVDDCLLAADALRRRGVEKILVFHARFAQCDRQAREKEVVERFGRNTAGAERAGWVLLGTQVVEQSLDLDFDVMLSDLAPVDLLIQRAGRLQRHGERDPKRPAGCALELVVLAPRRNAEPPEDWLGGPFSGTASVYRDHGALWRTVEALDVAGRVDTPGGLRDLIEAVYGSNHAPDALERASLKAEARDLTDRSTALYGTLKVAQGYDASDQPWVDDLQVPTRLGDETTTVRLARVRTDGTLVPWADEEPLWRAWALSEVKVRSTRIPSASMPVEGYRRAVEAARALWGRYEQYPFLLPLEEHANGSFRGQLLDPRGGKLITVSYSADLGLAFADEHPSSHPPRGRP